MRLGLCPEVRKEVDDHLRVMADTRMLTRRIRLRSRSPGKGFGGPDHGFDAMPEGFLLKLSHITSSSIREEPTSS